MDEGHDAEARLHIRNAWGACKSLDAQALGAKVRPSLRTTKQGRGKSRTQGTPGNGQGPLLVEEQKNGVGGYVKGIPEKQQTDFTP